MDKGVHMDFILTKIHQTLGNKRVIFWSIIPIFSPKYRGNGLRKSLFLIPFPTLGTHMKSRDEILFKGESCNALGVTP